MCVAYGDNEFVFSSEDIEHGVRICIIIIAMADSFPGCLVHTQIIHRSFIHATKYVPINFCYYIHAVLFCYSGKAVSSSILWIYV